MNAIHLSGVTKTFRSHVAVDDLSLSVPSGSIYGFIGPNGSGKTTTLRMILHIIRADSGEIEVLGSKATRAANDRVGYLPEERGLYKKMPVRRLLTYYASLKGMDSRQARKEAALWLERFDLGHTAAMKVESLSKGMAQKVQFIATVLTRPELIILDEPFSGLDPVNHDVLRDAIIELNGDGTTVVFSTHDMAMAEKMCDFIFMIFNGKKVLDGTLDDIQAKYALDTVRLRIDGGREMLESQRSIERIVDMGHFFEARLSGDSQELLQSLANRTRVELFEVTRPSLHDIFVRIAGAELELAQAPAQAVRS